MAQGKREQGIEELVISGELVPVSVLSVVVGDFDEVERLAEGPVGLRLSVADSQGLDQTPSECEDRLGFGESDHVSPKLELL